MPNPSYDLNSVLQFGRLVEFGNALSTELTAMKAVSASAIKYVSVANNTVSFFTTADGTGSAAFSFNFPNELVLDQLKTTFVSSFAFSAETYPGATNPSLEGKPVLVIAVKDTTAAGVTTTTYSFLDMTSLVDIYTAADNSITINGYTVAVKINPDANNRLEVTSTGLKVNVDDKADKVDRATAAAAHNPYDPTTQAEQYAAFNQAYTLTNHIVILDANGNIVDSGNVFATTADIQAYVATIFPTASAA